MNAKELIKPEYIADGKIWDAFGSMENESSAFWIVKLSKQRGHWGDFTREDIDALYGEAYNGSPFKFNDLISDGFIVMHNDDDENKTWFKITNRFVSRCFEKHPAKGD